MNEINNICKLWYEDEGAKHVHLLLGLMVQISHKPLINK
jgi:hypothetical protein